MTEKIEKSLLDLDFVSLTRRKFTRLQPLGRTVLYFLLLDRLPVAAQKSW